MPALLIEFDPPGKLLSMNDRMHWRPKAALTAAWVEVAWRAGQQWARRQKWSPVPCTVQLLVPVRDRRRRDPHNYFATVKPVIDGLVLAGLWPDDTPEWVRTIEPALVLGATRVGVLLEPREA